MLLRKIFHDSITRSILFAEKVVLCHRCKPRHNLDENCPYSYTHPKNFWHDQGVTPHWVNQISVQTEPSAVIHPNGGFQLDTPTLMEETDKGSPLWKSLVQIPAQRQTQIPILALILGWNLLLSPIFYRANRLSCLRKITCLRVKRIRLLQKRLHFKEPL